MQSPAPRVPAPIPARQELSDETEAMLAQVAVDPAVEKWKREVMRELAEGRGPTEFDLRGNPAGSRSPSSDEYPDGYWLQHLPRPEIRPENE